MSYTSAHVYAIGPRATPLVDEGTVFALGAEGHLHACRASDGEVVWQKNFVEDYGCSAKIPDFAQLRQCAYNVAVRLWFLSRVLWYFSVRTLSVITLLLKFLLLIAIGRV